MDIRGLATKFLDGGSLRDVVRRSSGVEMGKLLSDVKATAKKSLICGAMRNSSPPYPLLRRLWQFERVREYVADGESGPIPQSRHLRLWRDGFEAETEQLYDFERYPSAAYVSDYEYWVLMYYLNEPWTEAIDNKLLFHWMFAPFDEHRMDVYGLLEDGYLHPIVESNGPEDDRSNVRNGPTEVPTFEGSSTGRASAPGVDRGNSRPAGEQILDYLREERTLILKHATGAWGTEVLRCELRGETIRINGERHDEAAFKQRVSGLDGYLICEFVEQAAYSDRLFPDATNTVRVMTMWDDDAGEAFVPMAVQRIGTAESAPMDNAHLGALVASVDRKTGELSSAIASQHPEYSDEQTSTHPETGAQIEGVRIPGWRRIQDRVLQFAEIYPFIPYVGWDVLVTGDGEFTILEANNHADIYLAQLHRPFLADRRTRRFLVSNGVITERRAKAVADMLGESGRGDDEFGPEDVVASERVP